MGIPHPVAWSDAHVDFGPDGEGNMLKNCLDVPIKHITVNFARIQKRNRSVLYFCMLFKMRSWTSTAADSDSAPDSWKEACRRAQSVYRQRAFKSREISDHTVARPLWPSSRGAKSRVTRIAWSPVPFEHETGHVTRPSPKKKVTSTHVCCLQPFQIPNNRRRIGRSWRRSTK